MEKKKKYKYLLIASLILSLILVIVAAILIVNVKKGGKSKREAEETSVQPSSVVRESESLSEVLEDTYPSETKNILKKNVTVQNPPSRK